MAIGELGSLYGLLRGIQLSTYSYKDAPATSPRRLGFIIDDTYAPAAINPDGQTVDVYGYVSMAVAAIQTQARQIDDLKARIRTLEQEHAQRRFRPPSSGTDAGQAERPAANGQLP